MPLFVPHKIRKRTVPAYQFGNEQPGDHTTVAVDEIAEIVMRGHLTAVDRVLIAHCLLDKSVAGPGLDGSPAGFRHKVLRVPNDPGIVDDRRAWIFSEECICKQTDDIFAVDEGSRVIKEEAAIEITVPCNPEISARSPNCLCGGGAVFW